MHQEACSNLEKALEFIKNNNIKPAVAINPKTPLDAIKDVLDKVEMVLIMTVVPGFSGQKFMESVLPKISQLRSMKPELDIEVDGGIDAETIKRASESGANMFVSGSYLMNSDNVKEAVERLKDQWGGN